MVTFYFFLSDVPRDLQDAFSNLGNFYGIQISVFKNINAYHYFSPEVPGERSDIRSYIKSEPGRMDENVLIWLIDVGKK